MQHFRIALISIPGHWIETQFSLSSQQLIEIDGLSEVSRRLANLGCCDIVCKDIKDIVTKSFVKALLVRYGPKWPKELTVVLAQTVWAKNAIPAVGGFPHQNECNFEDLGVGDVDNIE